jgi:hypothetical protein
VFVSYAALHVTAFSNQAWNIRTLSFLFVVVICTPGGFFFSLNFHLYAFYYCQYNLMMGINKWRDRARDQEVWRHTVMEAKAHPGL